MKIMNNSADEIAVNLLRDIIPTTGVYETVNSTNKIMDNPSTHMIEYRS